MADLADRVSIDVGILDNHVRAHAHNLAVGAQLLSHVSCRVVAVQKDEHRLVARPMVTVRMRMRACVRARVRARVRACVRECVG